MILYKNMNTDGNTDGNTDVFDIVAVVLERDTLAPYLFIICLDYELHASIDLIKWTYTKKSK